MTKLSQRTWLLVLACFVSWCAFATRPSGWTQLAAMISLTTALVCVVVLMLRAVLKWRDQGPRNLFACLLIGLSFPLAAFCGATLRNLIFQHELDRWNQAVVWVASNAKPNQEDPLRLPTIYSDLAYSVHYRYDKSCGLVIDFFWGSGFPVKHVVRRYAPNAGWMDIRACSASWSRGRVLSRNWYEISD